MNAEKYISPKTRLEQHCYKLGFDDRILGHTLDECPVDESYYAECWAHGWHDANKKIESQNPKHGGQSVQTDVN